MIYGKEEVFIKPNKYNAKGINYVCLCGRNRFNETYIVKRLGRVEEWTGNHA